MSYKTNTMKYSNYECYFDFLISQGIIFWIPKVRFSLRIVCHKILRNILSGIFYSWFLLHLYIVFICNWNMLSVHDSMEANLWSAYNTGEWVLFTLIHFDVDLIGIYWIRCWHSPRRVMWLRSSSRFLILLLLCFLLLEVH